MFRATVAQKLMLALRAGKKTDQNSDGESREVRESIGPKPPEEETDQRRREEVRRMRIGAE
ncbi:hypothetical protein IEQ34_007824 [Dendrobium chrysotoxum]|uniref:Uncharacterized protein n=1 Tax=Dendrobium chrysotoxum TaxID=161865 RepID=A0AAV7H2Y4_DENCH|nr:hypothetical protein IEQ34_007824 [Dendrobium chrysotoxum]